MNHPHGLFDVDAFLTIFYDVDIQEQENVITNAVHSSYATKNQEVFNLKNILAYRDLLNINILHEEIHYWQAMTSPATILNYLNLSKLLYAHTGTLQFRHLILDYMPMFDNNIDRCMYVYYSHRMNFDAPKESYTILKEVLSLYKRNIDNGYKGTWKEFARELKNRIEQEEGISIYEMHSRYLHFERNLYNVVSDNPPLAMPLLTLPHLEKGKVFYAYAGVLDYFDIVYFTGDNLMESYAMVNEYISKGESIPEYDVSKGESNRYLGAYEVYRRMHAHRYSNERDLAISFLAIVDICFTTDPLHDHEAEFENENFRCENVSIPYRFGKLIYRAQGFRLFSNQNEKELARDIEQWQDEFCIFQGFYTPETCLKHMIDDLTYILFCNFEYIGYRVPDAILQMLKMSWMDEPDWEEKLKQVIKALNDAYQWRNENAPYICMFIQNHMVMTFVNALIYKLYNRGKVIISALYADEIRWSIEPGLFLIGGQYAYNTFGATTRTPLNDNSTGVWEPIESLVLKHMAKTGVRSCGFRESFYPCRYIANGYGCPLDELTSEERDKRKHAGMPEDWCHYTRIMNNLTVKEEHI